VSNRVQYISSVHNEHYGLSRYIDNEPSGGFSCDEHFWNVEGRNLIEHRSNRLANILNSLTASGCEMLIGELIVLHRYLSAELYQKIEPTERMYAYVTNQGTAMSETAICNRCVGDSLNVAKITVVAGNAEDYNSDDLMDCTGNDQLECQICGAIVK